MPSRRLAVEVQARLSAPLALGEALNAGGKFTLLVAGSDGTWPTDTRRRSQPVLVPEPLAATGDPRVALLEVSISREVGRAAAAHVSTIRPAPGRARRVRPIGGASQTAVEDASWAVTAAAEVADVMRTLHDEGVRCFYLYVAAPAAWCVLLGHQLNAVGQVVVYQRHPGSGEYLRGCSLGATWDHGLDALGA